jgi:hypothetical protein
MTTQPTRTLMPAERLDEIAAREQAAPAPPWRIEEDRQTLTRWILSDDDTIEIGLGYLGNHTEAEGQFIIHARQDVPDLLAENQWLRDTLRQVQEVAATNPAAALAILAQVQVP